jgi:predicted DNA-binding protein with PD1-like motif
MSSTEGNIGRVFVIRLDDGDQIPACIEKFALEKGLKHGQVIMLGGIDQGQIVTGPRYSEVMPPEPMLIPVDGAHDVLGVGVLAPGENGKPVLHMHAALGRSGQTLTGCLAAGVQTWLVGEVILFEICGVSATRMHDPISGFALLEPNK